MSEAVRIGLIGCGRIAELLYLPALWKTSAVKLAAAVDPLDERRRLVTDALPGCRGFETSEELLGEGGVQGVVVATPPASHVSVARPWLAAGQPVLIEKPLALELDEARALEEFEGRLMLGFNRREWEPARRLRDVLRARDRSRPATAHLVMTSDVSAWAPIGGVEDPLDDLASHQLDLLRFLFDAEPRTLCAERTAPLAVRLDVRLGNDVDARCEAAQGDVSRETIEVRCAEGVYALRMGSERITPAAGPWRTALDIRDRVLGRLTRRRSSMRRSYERQFERFAAMIRDDRRPEAGLTDGLAALRAVEAARRSAARNGEEVDF
jgi:predicted dehydrogenase